MAQSPEALRMVTNRRQDFDSYFPLEEHDDAAHVYDSDLASLPFPAPLTSLRASFRGDDFECDSFLVEHQKHGQLDDLLVELRGLSGLLESELIKGVEEDYEAFIGLGRMDPRKVDELTRGVRNVADQIRRIEDEVRANLNEVEDTLEARRGLRRRKRHARALLRISRGVDELAFLLEDDADLESALEALEHVSALTRKTGMPEYDRTRYHDLRTALGAKLQQSFAVAEGEDKVGGAEILRRFEKAPTLR